ncbi:hypothetical protein [Streptomyces melanogenes]|uniref:hypothetical protein n=1 Tax=Streptomyces melanogenes TaxID=67326 RepID=UPI00167E9EF9|nr:hypothetical protein [Streptomyces melanogenes]GGP86299.1 hypothetical protein GCM10010278_75860 [Streptomyces melanogenes]
MRMGTTDTPRVRTRLAAALAVCALPAAALVGASPAHAADSPCTVNDQPSATGTGTPGDDVIVCDGIVNFTVDGKGGTDKITITGSVNKSGRVLGGAGKDTITIDGSVNGGQVDSKGGDDTVLVTGAVFRGGSVLGGAGKDTITVEGAVTKSGSVLGGDDDDRITVDGAVVDGGKVDGGAGNDVIAAPNVGGTGENSAVLGGAGDDTIMGNDGDPETTDDTMTVGGHAATADGGAGMDTCVTKDIKNGMTVNCEA